LPIVLGSACLSSYDLRMHLPALQSCPALWPEHAPEATQRAIRELLHEGESKNTLASYRSALRYWAAWFPLRYGVALQLPVPAAAVLQFIVDHAQRTTEDGLVQELPAAIDQALVDAGHKSRIGPLALNTIVHRVAVLSKVHQLRSLENPGADARVKELLSMTRRAYAKRGALARKKDALTRDPLNDLLATCDDSLVGKRDRALLLFGWSTGGRRRSEIADANMQYLKPCRNGEFSYELVHSKTNQSGQDRLENEKPGVGAAAEALRDWFKASRITEGPIFRRIRRGGHLGEPLSAAAVRGIVRRRCALAGIDGDYSAHSLRSGFVTEACTQDVGLPEIMAMTGHRSTQTLLGYNRGGSSRRASVLRLLSGE
jgi:integrase